jgi:RNA-directed DNA polymerase
VRFTDERKYFVSEASVYRLLKAHDLITSPAYVVIKAANEFKDKTTAINQLWQTDFTYLKITGWGWYYLSTILDDSRATSWPGGSGPPCALPTSRPRWTRH